MDLSNDTNSSSTHCPYCSMDAWKQNMFRMVTNSKFHDVKFVVGKGSSTKKIGCNRTLLSIHCPVFEAMFSSAMRENNENCVKIPDITPSVFAIMLQWMATNTLNIRSISHLDDLIKLADKYQINGLMKSSLSFLKQNTITIHIITDSILKEYHGVDLGLSKNLKSMSIKLRILSYSSINDVIIAISKKLKWSTKQIQLWRISNRKNGTTRPNRYLSPIHATRKRRRKRKKRKKNSKQEYNYYSYHSSSSNSHSLHRHSQRANHNNHNNSNSNHGHDNDTDHVMEEPVSATHSPRRGTGRLQGDDDDEEDEENQVQEMEIADIDDDYEVERGIDDDDDEDGVHDDHRRHTDHEDEEHDDDEEEEDDDEEDEDEDEEDPDDEDDAYQHSWYDIEHDEDLFNITNMKCNHCYRRKQNLSRKRSRNQVSGSVAIGNEHNNNNNNNNNNHHDKKQIDWNSYSGDNPSKAIYARLCRPAECKLSTDWHHPRLNDYSNHNKNYNNKILLFLKFYDIYHEYLSVVGSILVEKTGKIELICEAIREVAKWSDGHEFEIYEEEDWKRMKINAINDYQQTIAEASLVDGDIIVFQSKSNINLQLMNAKTYLTTFSNKYNHSSHSNGNSGGNNNAGNGGNHHGYNHSGIRSMVRRMTGSTTHNNRMNTVNLVELGEDQQYIV